MTKNNTWNFDTTYSVGDILYASSSSSLSKLAIGSESQVLTVSSSLPSWQDSGVSPSTQTILYYEDYIGAVPGTLGFGCGQNGYYDTAGTAVFQTDSAHPGNLILTTGTSSTGTDTLVSSTGSLSASAFLFGGGTYTLTFYAKIPTLSTGTQRFSVKMGYMNNTTFASVTNGCWFSYADNVNSGNWQGVTMKASTSSTANSTTAADTNWHQYKIAVNAGATSVSFYIDGAEIANSPLTSNIPNATNNEVGICFLILKSVGTTARTLEIDWYDHAISLTSSR